VAEAWVISDVHMGGGQADPLEDFRADDALAAFIDAMSPDTTLVLNGDIIEFVQAPPAPPDGYLDSIPFDRLWTSDISLAKLRTVVLAHKTVFDSIGRFINDRGGKVIVTIGNHDLDLVFDDVQRQLREAVGADDNGSVRFITNRYRHDDVVIQHGHQVTAENCPVDHANFVHDVVIDGEAHKCLERVWGTDFMLQWYNAFEQTHPYADNVKPTISALHAALTARPRLVHFREFVRLITFLKKRGLPSDLGAAVLEARAPDVDQSTIVGAVHSDVWQGVGLTADGGELEDALASLGPEQRAVLRAAGTVEIPDPEPLTDPDPGSEVLGVFRSPRDVRAAKQLLSEAGTEAVVMGHTHKIIDGALGNRLYNPGCWIPRLNLDDPEVSRRVQEIGFCKGLLTDSSLYSSSLRSVRIRPGRGRSLVELVTIHEDV
jgi:UDP-2,3-diacylglucosamine pyrophosphatase LpxH